MKQSTGHLKLLVLSLVLIFLAVLVSIDRSAFAQATPDKEGIKKSGEKIETPPAAEALREFAPGSTSSIAEKNIFNPERKDFPARPGLKPVARPQIILYGVTIAGDYQAATIINPGRPLHKGERETVTLRIGEQIGGYKLAKISPDRILMEGTEDSFEVLLYDSKSAKRRSDVKTENRQAAVINPFTAESKELRGGTSPMVVTPELSKGIVPSQTTPERRQGSIREIVGPLPQATTTTQMPKPGESPMTPVLVSPESMPAPRVFTPPMSPTPVSPDSIPAPTLINPSTNTIPAPSGPIPRGRVHRGGTIAPTAPAPTN
jgi:hypothetical protein